jgi:hypothetical protein
VCRRNRGQCSIDLEKILPSLSGPIPLVWACNPSLWLMRLMENTGAGESARREVAGVKESLTMAKTRAHNLPSHEAMVKGRQISYQISNSRGSGHSPPYKV